MLVNIEESTQQYKFDFIEQSILTYRVFFISSLFMQGYLINYRYLFYLNFLSICVSYEHDSVKVLSVSLCFRNKSMYI